MDTIPAILSTLALLALIYCGYRQIPPEDPDTIAAREHYGRVNSDTENPG